VKNKKGNLKKITYNLNKLKFGVVGLKAINSGFITYKQKIFIQDFFKKQIKNKIKMWLILSPFYTITKKSIGVRMGKGQGKMIEKISKINNGKIFIEFCCIDFDFLNYNVKKIQKKLSIKTKLIV